MVNPTLQEIADALTLGALLQKLKTDFGSYELVEHWKQGEFHHDIVLRLPKDAGCGPILVVSTNCNGGVKEVTAYATVPERDALWHARCPDNPEFSGQTAPALDQARTGHWFDPSELLTAHARSEYLEEFRQRQHGGGWIRKDSKDP